MSVIAVDFEKIREVKKAKKISTYKIAEIDGRIQAPTVQRIIRGDSKSPEAINLKRICDVLEIPIEDVFIEAAA